VPLIYPEAAFERDRWIVGERPARNLLDPRRPYGFFNERELQASGETVDVSTILLTNRECPWRCLMCDLWRNTLTETVPLGAIPEQIAYALARLTPARVVKLYNSGSFFDRAAIPLEDYGAIAAQANQFERTIVESHPALIGETCLRFRDLLEGQLEVAMGLETVHPDILARLNKRMSLDQFSRAAGVLRASGIDLRVFILIKPPFMREEEALEWTARALDFAFDCGATAATLIPTRGGNGAMERIGHEPPRSETIRAALDYGLRLGRGRVFLDTWGTGN